MKRRALLEGSRRSINGIERRVRILMKLVRNGMSTGLDGLFRETADYILALEMRVKVMQIMVKTEKQEKRDVGRLMKEKDHNLEILKQEMVEKIKEQDVSRLMKERDHIDLENLKQEMEITKKSHEQRCLQFETHTWEVQAEKIKEQDVSRLMKEKNHIDLENLKQEMEITKKSHEQRCLQFETHTREVQVRLEEKKKEWIEA
ncbi:hypothetical protein HHK36_020911 [Tetracentron sinense]|uniref:Uncharacterized protein n=1 Tax=Tetracentron sinense TaxID=13715 RepID=A0A834YSJ9_TETSI|nr:hypothetical protein HHK36_020911 [Tetracentron sinense]